MPKKEKYDNIKGELQTFDILNCVPSHWFWGFVGHTAMVYRCRETGQLFVYESTQRGKTDSLSGVQLRPMREWLAGRDKVFVRRVTFGQCYDTYAHDHDHDRTPIIHAAPVREECEALCAEHIKKNRGKAYPDLKKPRWLWFVINAAIDLPWKSRLRNPDIDCVMFCTMLLGDCFRYCKLQYEGAMCQPSELEPDDTRPGGYFVNYMAEGVHVGPEIEIEI